MNDPEKLLAILKSAFSSPANFLYMLSYLTKTEFQILMNFKSSKISVDVDLVNCNSLPTPEIDKSITPLMDAHEIQFGKIPPITYFPKTITPKHGFVESTEILPLFETINNDVHSLPDSFVANLKYLLKFMNQTFIEKIIHPNFRSINRNKIINFKNSNTDLVELIFTNFTPQKYTRQNLLAGIVLPRKEEITSLDKFKTLVSKHSLVLLPSYNGGRVVVTANSGTLTITDWFGDIIRRKNIETKKTFMIECTVLKKALYKILFNGTLRMGVPGVILEPTFNPGFDDEYIITDIFLVEDYSLLGSNFETRISYSDKVKVLASEHMNIHSTKLLEPHEIDVGMSNAREYIEAFPFRKSPLLGVMAKLNKPLYPGSIDLFHHIPESYLEVTTNNEIFKMSPVDGGNLPQGVNRVIAYSTGKYKINLLCYNIDYESKLAYTAIWDTNSFYSYKIYEIDPRIKMNFRHQAMILGRHDDKDSKSGILTVEYDSQGQVVSCTSNDCAPICSVVRRSDLESL